MGGDRPGVNLESLIGEPKGRDVTTPHIGLFDLYGVFRERRLKVEDLSSFAEGATFVDVLPHRDVKTYLDGLP